MHTHICSSLLPCVKPWEKPYPANVDALYACLICVPYMSALHMDLHKVRNHILQKWTPDDMAEAVGYVFC